MNRFAPIFSEITDSSVWEEPYHIRIAWMTMLAKKGADHVVYCDAWKLHKWANITIEEAEEALEVLSNPDRKKPGQEKGGRRIERVEDGWRVINGQKYEELMRKIAARVRKAKWAREHRAKGKGMPLPGEVAYERAIEDGREGDAEAMLNHQPSNVE